MSGLRKKRPSSVYVRYPARVLNPGALERLGVLYSTEEGDSPFVVMSRADWGKVLRALQLWKEPLAPLAFFGRTWEDNPTIPRPRSARTPAPKPPPDPFRKYRQVPMAEAIALAEKKHQRRMERGMEERHSNERLRAALEYIKSLHTTSP